MAARNINDLIIGVMTMSPGYSFVDRLKGELRDYLAHVYMKHINQLRKDGKPWETAEYQIKEFLDKVLEELPHTPASKEEL